ncbi:hypothetical protein GH714_020355 [Hevea brasiliensis]|uniref:t-SNARE coiled-coil homology domain-containing protein n=1 Tax=Hevea brasiliensis TaxID=3981 RepID=A0A6A6M1J8_HEVBR|nr:hypothetical protein GH714_020355 [Hevea brasiliensis]
MSFQDLEAGRPFLQKKPKEKRPFSSCGRRDFPNQHCRLLLQPPRQFPRNSQGYHRIARETVKHKTRQRIGELVKETSVKLKEASETDHYEEVSPAKKISDAKLAKEFRNALNEFQKSQRLAAERETMYAPFVPKVLPSSYNAHEPDQSSSRSPEQQSNLLESRRQEIVLLDNEMAFNEAIIEEREQGIKEIQQQISEVSEIFKDLAVLVHEQGVIIDDIGSNIESSHAATAQATSQLAKASKIQRSNSLGLDCKL